MEGLCRAVAARGAGRAAPGFPLLAGPLVVLIVGRLRRLLARVARCAALVEAGEAARVRPRRASDGAVRRRAAGFRLPRGYAWLVRLVGFEAAGSGSQLQHLLTDPEMAALLEAAPRVRGMLRPLARMLAVESVVLRPVVALEAEREVTTEVTLKARSPLKDAGLAPAASNFQSGCENSV